MKMKITIIILLCIILIVLLTSKNELYFEKYNVCTDYGTLGCLDIDDFVSTRDSNYWKITDELKFQKQNRKKFRFIFYNNPFCLGKGELNQENTDEMELFLSGVCIYKGKFEIVDTLYIHDSLFNTIVGPALRIKHNNKYYHFTGYSEYLLDSNVVEFYATFFPFNMLEDCMFHLFQSTQESN